MPRLLILFLPFIRIIIIVIVIDHHHLRRRSKRCGDRFTRRSRRRRRGCSRRCLNAIGAAWAAGATAFVGRLTATQQAAIASAYGAADAGQPILGTRPAYHIGAVRAGANVKSGVDGDCGLESAPIQDREHGGAQNGTQLALC